MGDWWAPDQSCTRNGGEERMADFSPPRAPVAALTWPTDMKTGWKILGTNFHLPHTNSSASPEKTTYRIYRSIDRQTDRCKTFIIEIVSGSYTGQKSHNMPSSN